MPFSSLFLSLVPLLPLILAFPLEPRIKPPGELFGPSGKPDFHDVAQTTIPDCGYAATSAALAYVNPDFLTSIIRGQGDSAVFDIWDYPSYKKVPQTVAKAALPDNADNRGTIWWSGGIEQAAAQSGVVLPGVSPGNALAIMTGIKHASPQTKVWAPDFPGSLDQNAMWNLIVRASKTPMIMQTLPGNVLVGSHAYAILNATEDGGVRRVGLYNPWGSEGQYDYTAIWPQFYGIHHLEGFESGPAGGAPAPAPIPAPDPAPVEPVKLNAAETPVPAPAPSPNPPPAGDQPSTTRRWKHWKPTQAARPPQEDVAHIAADGERTTATMTRDGNVLVEVKVNKLVYVTAK